MPGTMGRGLRPEVTGRNPPVMVAFRPGCVLARVRAQGEVHRLGCCLLDLDTLRRWDPASGAPLQRPFALGSPERVVAALVGGQGELESVGAVGEHYALERRGHL